MEYFFEHFLADYVLLIHVLFDQLNEELVDLDLEVFWRLVRIRRLELGDDGLETWAVDDRVFRLSVKSNELAQYDNNIVIDANIVLKSTNTAPLQYLEEQLDCSLVICLRNFLCKLLRIGRVCDEDLNQSEYIHQNQLPFRVKVLKDQVKTIRCEKDLLDIGRVVAQVDKCTRGESS